MSLLLNVENIEVFYGELCALKGVSIRVHEGELLAVVGANGAGKTTMIRAIAGMRRLAGGRIEFSGRDISRADPSEICELGIGQVAEGRQIFPSLTVFENLFLGGSLRRVKRRRLQNLERVYATFPRLGERHRQKAGTLSGGEQQMLAIGRCMMAEPTLIMLDEPSLGLSPKLVDEMFQIVADLKNQGMAILLVEQNVAGSLQLADHGAVLEDGEVVLTGSGAAIAMDERVKRAYLGL